MKNVMKTFTLGLNGEIAPKDSHSRLFLFIVLAAISLLLAGARNNSWDIPAVSSLQRTAESLADTPEWQEIASKNPLWIIKINCN